MRRLALIVLALLLPVLVVACGGGSTEDTSPETVEGAQPQGGDGEEGGGAAGEEIFASEGCGNCHTFAAAESSGTIGPNLDDAQTGVDEAVTQITEGGGGMPSYGGKLSEEEIQAVAEYVSGG